VHTIHLNDVVEQRKFSRVPFQAMARLLLQGRIISVQLLDIALKGALFTTSAPEGFRLQERCRLVLSLTHDGDAITMDGTIAHLDGQYVGFQCQEIDISNLTRLRRLLELNTGDVDLIDRELGQLIRGHLR
jgi:hypothetical protein